MEGGGMQKKEGKNNSSNDAAATNMIFMLYAVEVWEEECKR